VFLNLLENARRYGRGTYTGLAKVHVSAQRAGRRAIGGVVAHLRLQRAKEAPPADLRVQNTRGAQI
jgi:signal transduction histidine kinase